MAGTFIGVACGIFYAIKKRNSLCAKWLGVAFVSFVLMFVSLYFEPPANKDTVAQQQAQQTPKGQLEKIIWDTGKEHVKNIDTVVRADSSLFTGDHPYR